jgi:hypothetical protein
VSRDVSPAENARARTLATCAAHVLMNGEIMSATDIANALRIPVDDAALERGLLIATLAGRVTLTPDGRYAARTAAELSRGGQP